MRMPSLRFVILVIATTLFFFAPTVQAKDNAGVKAAYDLFEAMEMGKSYGKIMNDMVEMQIQQAPQISPLRNVLVKFFEKYLGWKAIKKEMAEIYAAKFTVKELKELKKFYLTPLGKKAARLMPELTSLGAKIGEKRVMDNMAELQQMIITEAKKQGIKLQ